MRKFLVSIQRLMKNAENSQKTTAFAGTTAYGGAE
jgi:hypothetical protein